MKTKNNKTRKLLYINIKNSWREPGQKLSPFTITTCCGGFSLNPLWPVGEIHMDFSKRNDIIKYGVKKIS